MSERREFLCAMCDQTFMSGLSDAAAEQQLADEFPGASSTECVVICDPCYETFMASVQQEAAARTKH